MTFPFGKSFPYTYYPLADGQPVEPSTDAPTIYVYAYNNIPTRAQARVGGGTVLQTISSWTKEAVNSFVFTVAAISDPDPDSSTEAYDYWIAINYTLAASGQSQLDLRALPIVRVRGHHKKVATDEFDLTGIWTAATTYATSEQITDFIDTAKVEIQEELRAQGLKWERIHRPDRLSRAAAYGALMHIAIGQSTTAGDSFQIKYEEFKAVRTALLQSAMLEYDADGDGDAETLTKAKDPTGYFIR